MVVGAIYRCWVTFALVSGTVGGKPEAVSVTKDIRSLLPSQPAHSITVRQTLTFVCWTVWGIGQTALVTPLIHTWNCRVRLPGQTHSGCDYQRCIVCLVDNPPGQSKGARWVAPHHGVDLDICTVAERLLISTAHALRSVLADTPGVARVVGPLDHALATGQTVWQVHLILESCYLWRIQGNIELVR